MVDKLKKIWVDGEMVDWDDAKVHVLTHSLHYGVAAFEGIRAYKRTGSSSGVGAGNQGRCRIKSAGVHVAGLQAENGPVVKMRQGVCAHAALAINGHAHHAATAHAQQA